MKQTAVMICFARSGGTLLNRCLGSLPNVVIMSEISPLISVKNDIPKQSQIIKNQAKEWYNIDLKSSEFKEGYLELKDYCIKNEKSLILRDWSFNCFVPNKKNSFEPPNNLMILDVLENENIKSFAFIRDSIDVWISRGMPEIESFFEEYSKYIKEILKRKIKVFKYENFCEQPEKTIQNICNYLGLKYSNSFKDYNSFRRASGDLQIKGGSRGVQQKEIILLPRKRIVEKKIKEINECKKMIETNQLLGYSIKYESKNKESFLSDFIYKIKFKIKSIK